MASVVTRRLSQSREEWLQCAVGYLARADRTVAQVERFLRSKGATPTQAKQTIDRLSGLRYLDDCSYATRWVESRLLRKPMGRERLKAELLAKGLEEAMVGSVIDQALQAIDEEALARRALHSWHSGRRALPSQAAQYLRRRGFEEETIARIIRGSTDTEGRDA